MAFETITTTEIAAGEPVKQELFEKIKGNDDDFDDRLGTAEESIGRLDPFEFHFRDSFEAPFVREKALIFRVDAPCRLTAARLFDIVAGLSGTLEVDLFYKRGVGAWTSVLNAPITADASDGDLFITSGDLIFQDLLAGDFFAVDVNGVQDQQGSFSVIAEREVP